MIAVALEKESIVYHSLCYANYFSSLLVFFIGLSNVKPVSQWGLSQSEIGLY